MIGLVDCNNFYVSCERVFNPSLRGKPVIVLSNNDGCAISRSDEAKQLGIKMGAPSFLIREVIEKNNVHILSSNYALYGDMSRRVMSLLSSYVPELEIYSIDEAFLFFRGFEKFNLEEYGLQIIHEIRRCTGIPVSMGIAPTKALSKIANKLAKKNSANKGLFIVDKESIDEVLRKYPIEDVWGIGSQHAAMLKKNGVATAFHFKNLPGEWVRKRMTVVGLRLWEELHGLPRFNEEFELPSKKNICTSRSFGVMQTEYNTIEEATSTYAVRCAEKLRKQKSCAGVIMVFLHTNHFREDLQQYAKNIVIKLPVPTNSSLELAHYAREGLKRIYKKGYLYKKSGVIVSDIVSENNLQQNFFDSCHRSEHTRIMNLLDTINARYGRDTVRVAIQGFDKSWHLKQEKLSRYYTTRLSDIIEVNADT
jgi:DNA polymerase V